VPAGTWWAQASGAVVQVGPSPDRRVSPTNWPSGAREIRCSIVASNGSTSAELRISNFTVSQVWEEVGFQPRRIETFKFSTDPKLEAEVRDVVGLYLHPPQQAVVLC
jgi:hypothetical protein